MRALASLPLAALLLAGCETLFLGAPASGRYELASVNGRPVPLSGAVLSNPAGPSAPCQSLVQSGHLTLDSISRGFELHSQRRNSCTGQALPETRVTGSYLRSGGRLRLETTEPGGATRRLPASEGGRTITVQLPGERLLFRQASR